VGNAALGERIVDGMGTFWHPPQSNLFGRFVGKILNPLSSPQHTTGIPS
jgi:hypothetical protein